MKWPIPLLLLAVLLAAAGCVPGPTPAGVAERESPEPTSVTATARPTEPPSAPPTEPPAPEVTATAAAAPTEAPNLPAPTETPAAEQVSAGPPVGASLGDTWVRPADGMVMVYVPAGEFEMGSDNMFYNNERPPHDVVLDGFWIDQTEVTNAQYRSCLEAGVCQPPDDLTSFTRPTYYGHSTYDNCPVIHVNWYKAVAYCNWVGGRLPTEEQWEYAARGPEGRWFPWGDQPDKSRLNYCDASCSLDHADPGGDDGHGDTAPVGSYPMGASWNGAQDLVGNVWEWVWDWYGFYPAEGNPQYLATDMTARVIRGGAWDTDADHARCTFRNWLEPAKSHDSVGFRCVISESP